MHFGFGEILPTPGDVVGEDVSDYEIIADLLGEEVGIAGVAAFMRCPGRQGLEAFGDFKAKVFGDESVEVGGSVHVAFLAGSPHYKCPPEQAGMSGEHEMHAEMSSAALRGGDRRTGGVQRAWRPILSGSCSLRLGFLF